MHITHNHTHTETYIAVTSSGRLLAIIMITISPRVTSKHDKLVSRISTVVVGDSFKMRTHNPAAGLIWRPCCSAAPVYALSESFRPGHRTPSPLSVNSTHTSWPANDVDRIIMLIGCAPLQPQDHHPSPDDAFRLIIIRGKFKLVSAFHVLGTPTTPHYTLTRSRPSLILRWMTMVVVYG